MTGRRQMLCDAIAALSTDCEFKDVEERLEPFFTAATPCESTRDGIDKGEYTPLMLACDKGKVQVLLYLQEKLLSSSSTKDVYALIGKPTERCNDDENTALHHAARSGCSKAIPILAKMEGSSAFALGSERNSHGDTPLMIASAFGYVDFCRAWHDICSSGEKNNLQDIQTIWQLENDSGDSCLSLACGQGKVAVVQMLLSELHLDVEIELLDKCRASVNRMEVALRKHPKLVDQHMDQVISEKTCVQMLEKNLLEKSNLAASSLLQEVEQGLVPTSAKQLQKKRNAKQKGKAMRRNKQEQSTKNQLNEPGGRMIQRTTDNLEITTLKNGAIAVRVEGSPMEQRENTVQTIPEKRSVEDLFRERFQGGVATEVDAVMQALCLDIPMLLYTPHGMALDLSPSQLDAVQGILERQLRSVQEARAIQERMHATSSSNLGSSA